MPLLSLRYAPFEQDTKYMSIIRERVKDWLGMEAKSVFTIL
jgi:hypothetical protein